MVAQSQWCPRTRSRIPSGRHTGSVLQWHCGYGWIAPDTAIDHPEAPKHGWRVYVNASDVEPGAALHGGSRVSFFAYSDGNGIGAEEVRLEAADVELEPDAEAVAPEEGVELIGSGGAAAQGRRSVAAAAGGGCKGGVQRSIEKPLLRPINGVPGIVKGKCKGRGKGKGKEATRCRPMVMLSGPGGGPDRRKATFTGNASVLSWASSEMQGWRPAMEDASCAILGLDFPLESQAMFGIFDGHGGATVSRRASEDLPAEVIAAAAAGLGTAQPEGDEEGGAAGRALKVALPALDLALREAGDGEPGFLPVTSCGVPIPSDVRNAYALTGSTAVVALLECDGPPEAGRPLRVVVANCGDSRAILCRGGQAVPLSEDHKPDDPGERARIEKAGGFVAAVGPCQRIDGWGLNLSRALGDFHYKARDDLPPEEQKVSVMPDIRASDITEEDEFLLLGCDGVFELHTSQEAIDHVRQQLLAQVPLPQAVESLVDACCSHDLVETQGRGSDNVSAMVILLR